MAKRAFATSVLASMVVVVVIIVAVLGASHHRPSPAASNFNTISDSASGLSFNISKDFPPIPRSELSALNPEFSYGFRANNDSQALCIVSLAALKGAGSLTGDQLRDGVLKEVKSLHPSVKLLNPKTATRPVKFGSAKGVLLQMAYRDGKLKIKRVEALALGKTNQVIAYCQSLAADNPKYYGDFTVFFSSLRLDS